MLTNHHVVGGASRTTVTLHDKRRYSARVVARDPRTDVAVLQIEAEGPFPWVAFGDSDAVRVGEVGRGRGAPLRLPVLGDVGHRERARPPEPQPG